VKTQLKQEEIFIQNSDNLRKYLLSAGYGDKQRILWNLPFNMLTRQKKKNR
jgi:hypothetical protein